MRNHRIKPAFNAKINAIRSFFTLTCLSIIRIISQRLFSLFFNNGLNFTFLFIILDLSNILNSEAEFKRLKESTFLSYNGFK